ncbi:hypothetical protein PQX77_017444 [Marasmius sp. AFHP31]|nr:hypothetical protein PQX77_017444 [Marasmius sp. AFHP31]
MQSKDGCAILMLLEGAAELMENGPMEGMEFRPDDIDSDDEGCDMAEEWLEDDMDETTHLELIFLGSATKKRRVQVDELHEWFPWDSRLASPVSRSPGFHADDVTDLHARHHDASSMFSLFHTSDGSVPLASQDQWRLFGIQTYKYKGTFGHVYFVNSFADIIAQKKKGSHMVFVGRCWELVPVLKDGQRSWWVLTNNEGEFEQDEFLLTFPELIGHEHHYGPPSPVTRIQEVRLPNGEITPWSLTEPTKGNRWRELAKGHRVLSFLIWLYCDDTSGNTLKQWNEHNSFLFTATGLNQMQVSKEYNIHFLCTSNTALPLEMMDGVVDQIQ